eukprot:230072_1
MFIIFVILCITQQVYISNGIVETCQCNDCSKCAANTNKCIDLINTLPRDPPQYHHYMSLTEEGKASVTRHDGATWSCTCNNCNGLVGTWNCPAFYDTIIYIESDTQDIQSRYTDHSNCDYGCVSDICIGEPTDPCANLECGDEEICDAGECVRDCSVFAIDDFLNDCSTEFNSQNDAIDNLQSQISENDNDISTLNGNLATATADLQGKIDDNGNDITTLRGDMGASVSNLQGQVDTINEMISQFQKKLKEKGQSGAAMFDGINDDVNKPNSSVYVFNDNSWIQILMGVIIVLLVSNIGFMTYAWCDKKEEKGKYKRVRYMDSEDVDSEANLK